eukprot:138229-Amphidinium_carterae.1
MKKESETWRSKYEAKDVDEERLKRQDSLHVEHDWHSPKAPVHICRQDFILHLTLHFPILGQRRIPFAT